MTELGVYFEKAVGCEMPAERAAVLQRQAENIGPRLGRWLHHESCFLMIAGDGPLTSLIHSTPRVNVVCRTDLLNLAELQKVVQRPAEGAELLSGLYGTLGDAFVNRLRGTYSIILHDRREQVVKAWIDHFGGGRLAYLPFSKGVAVSSDIRWLRAWSGRPGEVDSASVMEYLQYSCIPAPRTIYQDIRKIEPGQMLTSSPAATTRTYWDLRFEVEPGRREDAWSAALFSAVRESVAASLRLPEASRAGCFLSGGTDSSSVTGLTGQLTAEPPRSFSIGFDDPRYNEIGYARIAAKAYGADHHEYFVKPGDILQLAQSAAGAFDEPFGNSSIIPTYYCARIAADHGITHLLAGDGGDEIFGGNERYVADAPFQRYASIPRWGRRWLLEPAICRAASFFRIRTLDLASRFVRRASIPLPDRLFSYALLSSVSRKDLFADDFLSQMKDGDPLAVARRHYGNAPSSDSLNRWLYLDLKITIGANDLRKVTRMSELAGITVRYPLLSPDLADFSGRIPPGLKVKNSQLRYIFKKAMTSVLPQAIIQKSKHGFGLPYSVWVGEHRPLRDFTFDLLGSSRCRQRGYFRRDLLEWLWQGYERESRIYYGDVLWVFLMLEQWHLHHDDLLRAQAS